MAKPQPIKMVIVYNDGHSELYECEKWGYLESGAIEVTPIVESYVGLNGSKILIKRVVIPFTSIKNIVFI